jgi:DNA polymerase III alpha subunit
MSTRYSEKQLIEGVLKHGPDILSKVVSDLESFEKYLSRVNLEKLNYPTPKTDIDICNWLIPEEYKNFDIEEFLVQRCPEENYDRLIQELTLYREHNFIPVLRTMKYIVDTLRKNDIVWGVGRGSSVASYVLFLLGVHKIDSVKYNLPIDEFFKGEQNG